MISDTDDEEKAEDGSTVHGDTFHQTIRACQSGNGVEMEGNDGLSGPRNVISQPLGIVASGF